ncbi:hypothetical protein RND71_040816 [Anisodus tanguticus]|uniref:Uncharacterized protein n=1 Tax=Anisodus tanguticus TaxID=243964 RepID=A0AAE1UW44_9SOLA|nr:hypothetical protein RND71_040816 [Anisodus tanguticus]
MTYRIDEINGIAQATPTGSDIKYLCQQGLRSILTPQALGLPFLSPYLRSIGSDYRHGANFATLASTVRLPQTGLFVAGVSPFSFQIQLGQMKEFKVKVDELQHHKGDNALGGRTFWVLNLTPIGCYPAYLVELPHESSDLDQFGCMISYNNAVVDYNNMLKAALAQTRKEITDANVVYVDTHGLKYGPKACCEYGGGIYNFNQQLFCGKIKQVNGTTVAGTACEDPQNYVSWDGLHATDAANKLITYAIVNSSYFDPPFPLHHYCDIQPIG